MLAMLLENRPVPPCVGAAQIWTRIKSMAPKKKVAVKRQAWNKGLEVGKRDGFTRAQVKQIRGLLTDRGAPGLRDLALFSMAIDTMLHAHDLLPLVVGDVQNRNGSIRPLIEVARAQPHIMGASAITIDATCAAETTSGGVADMVLGPFPRSPDCDRLSVLRLGGM